MLGVEVRAERADVAARAAPPGLSWGGAVAAGRPGRSGPHQPQPPP